MAMIFKCDKCGEVIEESKKVNHIELRVERDDGEHKSGCGGELCPPCELELIHHLQKFIPWPVYSR